MVVTRFLFFWPNKMFEAKPFISGNVDLILRVFSLSNMVAAGEKTLAHSELKLSLIGAFFKYLRPIKRADRIPVWSFEKLWLCHKKQHQRNKGRFDYSSSVIHTSIGVQHVSKTDLSTQVSAKPAASHTFILALRLIHKIFDLVITAMRDKSVDTLP